MFIDRDGRHFHDVLNYLRDGRLAYPPDGRDFKYLLELRAEAEFYGLTGLVLAIDRFPYGMVKVRLGLLCCCGAARCWPSAGSSVPNNRRDDEREGGEEGGTSSTC